MSITFLIPSYNYSSTIEQTINEINNAISKINIKDYEILIIDDCSPDNAYNIIENLMHKNKKIRAFKNKTNLGFCKNFIKGFNLASKEFLMFIPSDNVIDASQIIKIVKSLKDNDMVLVDYSNLTENREINRVVISKLYTFAINLFFLKRINYFNGTNIYRTRLLKKIEIFSDSFVFQSEIVLKMLELTNYYSTCSVSLNKLSEKNTTFFQIKNIKKNILDFLKLILRRFS